MPYLIIFTVIIVMILFTALYVAAEFATASARRSRLQEMAEGGSRLAQMMLPIVENPENLDTYIAACQLGITASTLLLGFYGQATLGSRLAPLVAEVTGVSADAATSISTTAILLVLTVVGVLLGELVPKNAGIRYPEQMAVYTVIPMRWSMAIFRPLIWFFNGSGRLILRMIGVNPIAEHSHVHDPDEIRLLVQESGAGGVLGRDERQLLENALNLGSLTVRQVMIPRTRMFSAPVETPPAQLLALLSNSPHSRAPLYTGSVDNIVGVVHLLDLLCLRLDPQGNLQTAGDGPQSLADFMHPVTFVPEHVPVDEVFARLQKERHHMAIVLDEYGGTAGLVALEDLVEEIFGEIQDEFDTETPLIQPTDDGRIQVRGDMGVEQLNDLLDLVLPTDEVDTVGGLVVAEMGRLLAIGEEVEVGGLIMRVDEMERNSVVLVSFPATDDQQARLQEALS
ncbi:MAG: HlyC/CorC family transporter [Caldilineaceae bacterium]|nr:HlyC/CorC family transporter [Caldilineaceae bacterium]